MFKTFFICCFFSLLLSAVLVLFTQSIWRPYLDRQAPQISILKSENRIGIGSAGGKFNIHLKDSSPGLEEVVVRIKQLREDHELLRKKLKGAEKADLEVIIPGHNGSADGRGLLTEGLGEIEVVAFDRSFYINKATASARSFVDSKPPRLEPVSMQHNLRQGGVQLVFYFARDENLSYSGVKVGDRLFPGFPASLIDSTLAKDGLFVAIYSVPVDSDFSANDVRLVAQDIGGNLVEQPFYNKIARRKKRLLNSSNSRLLNWISTFKCDSDPQTDTPACIQDQETGQKLLDRQLMVDAATLTQGFLKVEATALAVFADQINKAESNIVGNGEVFIFTGTNQAKALHQGEVVKVSRFDNGYYLVRIGHGLGLTTDYIGLISAEIQEGQQVGIGQLLGPVRDYYAIRTEIAGQAIDPTEWWSQDWIAAHLVEKISDVKRSLGVLDE